MMTAKVNQHGTTPVLTPEQIETLRARCGPLRARLGVALVPWAGASTGALVERLTDEIVSTLRAEAEGLEASPRDALAEIKAEYLRDLADSIERGDT